MYDPLAHQRIAELEEKLRRLDHLSRLEFVNPLHADITEGVGVVVALDESSLNIPDDAHIAAVATPVVPIEVYFGVTLGTVTARINNSYGTGIVELLTSVAGTPSGYDIVSTGVKINVLNSCDAIPNEYCVEVWREPFANRWMVHPLCEYTAAFYSGSGSGLGGSGGGVPPPTDENCGPCGPCMDFPCSLCLDTTGLANASCGTCTSFPNPLKLYKPYPGCIWQVESGFLGAPGPVCDNNYMVTFLWDGGSNKWNLQITYGGISTVAYVSVETFTETSSETLCKQFFDDNGVVMTKIGEGMSLCTWPLNVRLKACATLPPQVYFSDQQICQDGNTVEIVGSGFTTPGDTTVTFDPAVANHVVSVTDTTLMLVEFDGTPQLGALAASVENSNGKSTEVQVAEVIDCTSPPNHWWCVIGQWCSTDSDCGTCPGGSDYDFLACKKVPEWTAVGDTRCVYIGNGKFLRWTAQAGPYASEAACIAAPCASSGPPTVNYNNADRCQDATTLTISGTGFTSPAATNTVTFNLGAVGTATAVVGATTLVVTFSTQPTGFGNLTAIVTNANGTSSPAVQVATIIDCSVPGTPLWSDTFTDSNGTSLSAHTPNTSPGGVGYTEVVAFEIQSNVATENAGVSLSRAKFNPGLTATTTTVLFTITDLSRASIIELSPRNDNIGITPRLTKISGTSWELSVGTDTASVTLAASTVYTLVVQDTGTSITATVNGVSATETSSAGTGDTRWVLRAFGNIFGGPYISFDNLQVTTP